MVLFLRIQQNSKYLAGAVVEAAVVVAVEAAGVAVATGVTGAGVELEEVWVKNK